MGRVNCYLLKSVEVLRIFSNIHIAALQLQRVKSVCVIKRFRSPDLVVCVRYFHIFEWWQPDVQKSIGNSSWNDDVLTLFIVKETTEQLQPEPLSFWHFSTVSLQAVSVLEEVQPARKLQMVTIWRTLCSQLLKQILVVVAHSFFRCLGHAGL